MGLKDWLLGKKVTITDDFFGEIESERFKKSRRTSVSWYINYQLSCFKKETFIISEGDKEGLNPVQKEELKHFLENFESYYAKEIDKLVLYNSEYNKLKYWRQDYYMVCILPDMDSPTKFEVNFESYQNEKDGFGFYLNNREIEKFEIFKY